MKLSYSDALIAPCGGMPFASTNRYLSPASPHPDLKVSFAGFPRTFIAAGEVEYLLPAIKILRDRMVRDLGEDAVVYFEAVDAPHDYMVFKLQPETRLTLEAIARWSA